MESSTPIVYFDGVCNLCTGLVRFILQRDKKQRFRFASLQGNAGRNLLLKQGMSSVTLNTFLLTDNGKVYSKSSAALKLCLLLGGGWSILYLFIVIPSPVRDALYTWVASHRYQWFGKKQTCWLPDQKWADRFLD